MSDAPHLEASSEPASRWPARLLALAVIAVSLLALWPVVVGLGPWGLSYAQACARIDDAELPEGELLIGLLQPPGSGSPSLQQLASSGSPRQRRLAAEAQRMAADAGEFLRLGLLIADNDPPPDDHAWTPLHEALPGPRRVRLQPTEWDASKLSLGDGPTPGYLMISPRSQELIEQYSAWCRAHDGKMMAVVLRGEVCAMMTVKAPAGSPQAVIGAFGIQADLTPEQLERLGRLADLLARRAQR